LIGRAQNASERRPTIEVQRKKKGKEATEKRTPDLVLGEGMGQKDRYVQKVVLHEKKNLESRHLRWGIRYRKASDKPGGSLYLRKAVTNGPGKIKSCR